jgi:uncharacterized protein (TIGR02996 family)
MGRADLEAAVMQDPDDDAALAVYADFLQLAGDPLGELIAVELGQGESPALRERLGGGLPVDITQLGWRRGLIERARLGATPLSEQPVASILGSLLALPAARFLRRLSIGALNHHGPQSYTPILDLLARAAPPSLGALHLGDDRDEVPLSWSDVGDLGPLLARHGDHLRELVVRGAGFLPRGLVLPELTRLVLAGAPLPEETIHAAAATHLPRATSLTLCFGETPPPKAIAPILGGERLPALRHLALLDAGDGTDALCASLARSPLLARLQALDLSSVGEDGAEILLEEAPRFAHLRRLSIDGCEVPRRLRAPLRQLCAQVRLSFRTEFRGCELPAY